MDYVRRRLLPEDTVAYRIYTGRETETAKKLELLAVDCNHLAGTTCSCHVWHYAPFHVRPSRPPSPATAAAAGSAISGKLDSPLSWILTL